MLILCSYGAESPIMVQALTRLIPLPEQKTVLLVPFAAGVSEKAVKLQISELSSGLGFLPEHITVMNENNLSEWADKSFAYIYVSGGSLFKLLKQLRRINGAEEKIRNAVKNGSIYIGVSAGAELACKDVAYVREMESLEEDFMDFHALGLTDYTVIPHANVRWHEIYLLKQKYPENRFLYVSDFSLITVNEQNEICEINENY